VTIDDLQRELLEQTPRLRKVSRLRVRRQIMACLEAWPRHYVGPEEELVRLQLVSDAREEFDSVWLWFALRVAMMVIEALIEWWLKNRGRQRVAAEFRELRWHVGAGVSAPEGEDVT